MPLQLCSRTDFRKSLRRTFLVLLSVAVAYPVLAQVTHEDQVLVRGPVIDISIRVEGVDPAAFLANLYDGMTAQIEYQIRVSVPRDEPFQLLGPRLLHEEFLNQRVYFDRFSQRFHLSNRGGVRDQILSEEQLLERFFSLSSYEVGIDRLRALGFPNADRYLVETQVIYNPILFVPALRILSVFLTDDEIVTNRRSTLLSGVGE